MIEVLWHGRGGQGAFTAARLLGAAASSEEGAYALAFPSFGPERRGAPMRAFTKIDNAAIGDRSAIASADYAVYLDATLNFPGWEEELKPGAVVLVNLGGASALDRRWAPSRGDIRVFGIDADSLSAEYVGRPIPNTAFLGALAALGVADADGIAEAIRLYMAPKLHDANIAIVKAAEATMAALLEESGAVSAGASQEAADIDVAARLSPSDVAVVEAEAAESAPYPPELDTFALEARDYERAVASSSEPDAFAAHHPLLRDQRHARGESLPSLDLEDYARTTCFEAGHLVESNAGWRNVRPVLAPSLCTSCLQCWLYCPDGAILKTHASKDQLSASDSDAAAVAVDYGFCKGCGICVRVCRFNALAMIPEAQAQSARTEAR